ncbi:MAG: aminotransferase, partial [Caldilineaceae bacterium]|nr:aminotransferase [Caldilineaceae bacterium]
MMSSTSAATPFMPAARVQSFGPTVFAEFTALAIEHDAVNLGQGFPNFPAPDFIKEAAATAITGDLNQYARAAGHPRLVN